MFMQKQNLVSCAVMAEKETGDSKSLKNYIAAIVAILQMAADTCHNTNGQMILLGKWEVRWQKQEAHEAT